MMPRSLGLDSGEHTLGRLIYLPKRVKVCSRKSGGDADNIRGGRTLPYEIKELRLLLENHALSGYVSTLA